MIRLVPIALMLGGFLLVWFLDPPWRLLIAISVVAGLFVYKIFVDPKYYR